MLYQAKAPMLTREGNVVYVDPAKQYEAMVRMNEILTSGISAFLDQATDGHIKEYFRELLNQAERGGNYG